MVVKIVHEELAAMMGGEEDNSLDLAAKPKELAAKQACAAVGQSQLMHAYASTFARQGLAGLHDAPRSGAKPRLDYVGTVLSASGLGLVVFGVFP